MNLDSKYLAVTTDNWNKITCVFVSRHYLTGRSISINWWRTKVITSMWWLSTKVKMGPTLMDFASTWLIWTDTCKHRRLCVRRKTYGKIWANLNPIINKPNGINVTWHYLNGCRLVGYSLMALMVLVQFVSIQFFSSSLFDLHLHHISFDKINVSTDQRMVNQQNSWLEGKQDQ